MGKVFISYVNRNRKVAESLCSHLEGHGIPCWMAPRDISSGVYAGEITRAIKSADIFVVICSKVTRESDHVKNEVNLAVNNCELIVPYCLDDSPFDDVLEYYLSSKHRVISNGRSEDDFNRIERIIREHREGENPAPVTVAPTRKAFPWRWSAPLLIALALVLVAFFYFKNTSSVREPLPGPAETPDTLAAPAITQAGAKVSESVTAPKPIVPAPRQVKEEPAPDPDADTFTGTVRNGYPDGYGVYTFKKRRRIDMHDTAERFAEPGDYIKGTWKNGHLCYGEWYGKDDVKKDYIQLGDNPDYRLDQQLGKCVKP